VIALVEYIACLMPDEAMGLFIHCSQVSVRALNILFLEIKTGYFLNVYYTFSVDAKHIG
jgi:hypothetical protein